jgi:ribose/xylose/arabinose/galactoside ABC-type transport system permease subunit
MPLSAVGINYMIAVLSGTLVRRVLCVCAAVSSCATACVGVGVAAECAWELLDIPTESNMRFLVCVVPALVRREWARSMAMLSGSRVSRVMCI